MSTPKSPVDIRPMTIEDLAVVYALGEELFSANRWTTLYRTWDEYEVLTNYMSDPETSLVAELNDEVVGFALGSLIEKPGTAWTYGYLVWFGVAEAHSGKGIATKLMKRLTEAFIEAGARIMLVDTDAENEKALSFFRRSGFGQPKEHIYLSRNLTHHPAYEKLRAEEKGK